jgi:integral membrane protein (TIGR01906 family)
MKNKRNKRNNFDKNSFKDEKKSFVDYLIYFPRIVFSIFILLIIFISPLLMIAGSKSFYDNNLNENCFQMISEKDCKELQMNAFNFLKGKETLDDRYSMNEKSHFMDVKIIMDFAKALISALLIFVIIYFIILYFFDKSEIFRTLKLAGLLSVSFIFILLLAILINFNSTFFLFHAIIFPQGNWSFPFDSTIITVFSEQFFVHAAMISFILSLGAGLILLGVGYSRSKHK